MAGPHPDVAAARAAVRSALTGLPPGAPVLVACSGGADSLALAAAAGFEAPRSGLRVGSVSVDHGLRPGSREEAERAAGQCAALGLAPSLVTHASVGAGGGPEGAAREARYTALARVARDRVDQVAARREGAGASWGPGAREGTGPFRSPAVVLLGHTLDDQAETVLLGLARGSGARSLSGMPPEVVD
ncbi:ATP-binding protein, partial [Georgenia sp. 10Sc9-8]|nr:ATP-binding protein [Georgenia halotolerans]